MNFKRASELLQIANNYNIEVSEVFSALKQALEVVLKCGKLHADFSNEKFLFMKLFITVLVRNAKNLFKLKEIIIKQSKIDL